MRVVRWRKADTGAESFTISDTGIYFPVGKVDSAYIARYAMASSGQTATIDRVVSADGTRVGTPGISVSGTTEVVSNDRRGLSTGIIVTSISGTLIPVLDNLSPITNWPDNLGRFTAMEDLVAYCYGSTVPVGTTATVGTTDYKWGGVGMGWVSSVSASANAATTGAITIRRGGVIKFGVLIGSVAFSLSAETSEAHWIFSTGGTPPAVTWPAGITWNGAAPTIVANKTYEISILENLAVWGQF